ncbi:hypothetical protein D3C75_826430 [compost metagenome]
MLQNKGIVHLIIVLSQICCIQINQLVHIIKIAVDGSLLGLLQHMWDAADGRSLAPYSNGKSDMKNMAYFFCRLCTKQADLR